MLNAPNSTSARRPEKFRGKNKKFSNQGVDSIIDINNLSIDDKREGDEETKLQPTNDDSNPQQGTHTKKVSITNDVSEPAKDTALARARSEKSPSETSAPSVDKKPAQMKIPPTKKDSRKLFVGGLPPDVNGDEFREFFEQYGSIIDSVVMFDRDTGKSRCFGFVTFEDASIAREVLASGTDKRANGTTNVGHRSGRVMIKGKLCEVKAAEPKEGHSHGHHGGHARGGRNSSHIRGSHNSGHDNRRVHISNQNNEPARQDAPESEAPIPAGDSGASPNASGNDSQDGEPSWVLPPSDAFYYHQGPPNYAPVPASYEAPTGFDNSMPGAYYPGVMVQGTFYPTQMPAYPPYQMYPPSHIYTPHVDMQNSALPHTPPYVPSPVLADGNVDTAQTAQGYEHFPAAGHPYYGAATVHHPMMQAPAHHHYMMQQGDASVAKQNEEAVDASGEATNESKQPTGVDEDAAKE